MEVAKASIPQDILNSIYTRNSLKPTENGFKVALKNRLIDIVLVGIKSLTFNNTVIDASKVTILKTDGHPLASNSVSEASPFSLILGDTFDIIIDDMPLVEGEHEFTITLDVQMIGEITIVGSDKYDLTAPQEARIPHSHDDNYTSDAIRKRQDFIQEYTGVDVEHIKSFKFDGEQVKGNIENFTGVAQIPLGLAGPLKVNGEHAMGEFIIPLATSEGTLVASYNRGIKVLNLSGGVKTTVVGDAMQRAPVFAFEDARIARDFVEWVQKHIHEIRATAEKTSSVAHLQYIDPYLASRYAYLRFNFQTGDAAGQNMVGRATYAACEWILKHYTENEIKHFYLESNFATDKKPSQVNVLHTRGKRATAEAIISRDVLKDVLRVTPESLHYHLNVATTGAFLSGANNNGAHSANAITAMFIATGQDVANVAESSAGVLVSEVTEEGDFYVSITIPSLIVATYGGGTGLPTQRECLEIMGCFGRDKVKKLAEIIAGVVLAGELSLGAAISSSDWVTSHEFFGRNR